MKKYILEIYKPGKTIKIKNTLVRTPVKYIIDENDKKNMETFLKNIYGFDEKDYKIIEIKENKKNIKNDKKVVTLINKKEKVETNQPEKNIEENKKETNQPENNIEENKKETNQPENNIEEKKVETNNIFEIS